MKLFSVRGRHLCSDLIKYWRIICCDLAGFDLSVLFQRSGERRTHEHRLKLVMPPCNPDVKQQNFDVCCIRDWNSLPIMMVESQSLASFKYFLAEFLENILIEL